MDGSIGPAIPQREFMHNRDEAANAYEENTGM